MFGARTLTRHAQLMNSMADTRSVDLPAALADGRVTGEALRAAVIRCTGCDDPDGCAGWLAEHAGGADQTPNYCRNRGFLEALAPKPAK